MPDAKSKLTDDLVKLRDLASSGPLTLGGFLDALNARGHAFVCLILAIPFLTPIPMPGLSIPFGIMIVVSAVSLAAGIPPWIPSGWRRKQLPAEMLIKALDLALKVFRKIEFLVKPRGRIFVRFPGVTRLSGIAMAICGGLLALPLPPGTNFPPALGVVLVAIGVLEGDSILLGLGYLVVAINALVFGSVTIFGFEFVSGLWHK